MFLLANKNKMIRMLYISFTIFDVLLLSYLLIDLFTDTAAILN